MITNPQIKETDYIRYSRESALFCHIKARPKHLAGGVIVCDNHTTLTTTNYTTSEQVSSVNRTMGDYGDMSTAVTNLGNKSGAEARAQSQAQETKHSDDDPPTEHGCCYRCCARIGRMIYFASF